MLLSSCLFCQIISQEYYIDSIVMRELIFEVRVRVRVRDSGWFTQAADFLLYGQKVIDYNEVC